MDKFVIHLLQDQKMHQIAKKIDIGKHKKTQKDIVQKMIGTTKVVIFIAYNGLAMCSADLNKLLH